MKYAIVEDGGKQYRAIEGSNFEVDRFPSELDEQIDLEKVLLIADGETTSRRSPGHGAKVMATVVSHVKGPKIVGFRYKPKKRIRSKFGHRQQYTRLRIDAILNEGDNHGS